MKINWWAITTIGFWICGAISTIFTKDPKTLRISLEASFWLGFLYLITH